MTVPKKRYQVFISSTYIDLKHERSVVLENILRKNCFPAGMELFPAGNDDQFEYIKKIIDDSDYYLLIIGGKYGSLSTEGISFTEKEYDYAIQKGIPVMSFIHSFPDELPEKHSELDAEKREKLEEFKNKVKTGKLVNFWENADGLATQVVLSLGDAFRTSPRQGWQRTVEENSKELLEQINQLHIENKKLESENSTLKDKITSLDFVDISNIAFEGDTIVLQIKYESYPSGIRYINEEKIEITLDKLFLLWAPYLYNAKNVDYAQSLMGNSVSDYAGISYPKINANQFQVIKQQYYVLGLIDIFSSQSTKGGVAEFISLTKKGKNYSLKHNTIKK